MQTAKLGEHEISRLICAGNLFAGFAHGGELKYLGKLFSNYSGQKAGEMGLGSGL